MRSVKKRAQKKDSSADGFGLKPVWRKERSISAGLLFTKSEMEILLLNDPALPNPVEVHSVVEDVISALPKYVRQGYTIAIEPFDISMGKCAVVQDSSGTRLCILDKTSAEFDLVVSTEGSSYAWFTPSRQNCRH